MYAPMSVETPEQRELRMKYEDHYRRLDGSEVGRGRFVNYATMAIVDKYGNFYFSLPTHCATKAELSALCEEEGDYIPE